MKIFLVIIILFLITTICLNIYLINETIYYRNAMLKMVDMMLGYEKQIIQPLYNELFPNGPPAY